MTSAAVRRWSTGALFIALAMTTRAQPARPNPWRSAEEAISARMGIVGYADRLSVQPGETINFMVSSTSPTYRADIVRMIHGDPNPKGPGIKEQIVTTAANRDYPGKPQVRPLGSYVRVSDAPPLRLSGSLTITAWIAPTRHTAETSMPAATVQGVVLCIPAHGRFHVSRAR